MISKDILKPASGTRGVRLVVFSLRNMTAGAPYPEKPRALTSVHNSNWILALGREAGNGKTMKTVLLSAISMLLSFSCLPVTTVQDIEKKTASEDFIGIPYEHDWEKVYDAIRFVWSHSEVLPISLRYQESNTDYSRQERAIWVRFKGERSIDMAILLESRGAKKTYVQFVEGDPADYLRSEAIQYMIDELKFYLENGEKAYKKYTHEKNEALKKESPLW
jgi:hypothetical protein